MAATEYNHPVERPHQSSGFVAAVAVRAMGGGQASDNINIRQETRNEATTQRVAEQQRMIQEQQEKLLKLRVDNDVLSGQYERARTLRSELEVQLKQVQEEKDGVIQSTATEMRNMKTTVNDMKAQRDMCKKASHDLKLRYEEVQAALDKSEAEIEMLKQSTAECESELKDLDHQYQYW